MNLKRYLLIRMVTLGLLCWVAVAGFVIYRTNHDVKASLDSDAKQLQTKVEYAFYMRRVAPEAEGSTPMLGDQYGLKLGPYCLQYEGFNGEVFTSDCEGIASTNAPAWLSSATGLPTEPMLQTIHLWGQPFGELKVTPNANLVLEQFWRTLRDLLLLTAATVISLCVLCYVAIGRALAATTGLVQRLDNIDSEQPTEPSDHAMDGPVEYQRIANGIDRLSERLKAADLARQNLTRQLLQVQEAERRDLAHLVHADLGQALSLVSLQLSQLRTTLYNDPEEAEAQLDQLSNAMDETFDKLRGLLVNKCPPVMEGANLGLAIQDMCTDWRLRTGKHWKLTLSLDEAALTTLDKDRALCVYRTIEESLANIAKHGRADKPVQIELRQTEKAIEVSIANTPKTQSLENAQSSGMGLQLLAERIRVYGGLWSNLKTPEQFKVMACFQLELFA